MLIEDGIARIEEAYEIEQRGDFVGFKDEHKQVIFITYEAVEALYMAGQKMEFHDENPFDIRITNELVQEELKNDPKGA